MGTLHASNHLLQPEWFLQHEDGFELSELTQLPLLSCPYSAALTKLPLLNCPYSAAPTQLACPYSTALPLLSCQAYLPRGSCQHGPSMTGCMKGAQ